MCVWHSRGPFISQSISCTHLLLFLRLPHWAVVFLLVEDFFHFTVLQVVQLSDRILRPLDQIDEDPQRTLSPHELMLGRTKRAFVKCVCANAKANKVVVKCINTASMHNSIYLNSIYERKVCFYLTPCSPENTKIACIS